MIKVKLEACEYAEKSSYVKAAKHLQISRNRVHFVLTDYD